jgi:hypothetical protein
MRINMRPQLSMEEMLASKLHTARIRMGLENIDQKAMQEDRDAVGELRQVWFKAGSPDNAVKAFQKIGFSAEEGMAFSSAFQAEHRAIMESGKLTDEQKRSMVGGSTDPRGLLLKLMPDAQIEEGQGGNFAFTRQVNGKTHRVSVEFHGASDLDVNTREAATSISEALRTADFSRSPGLRDRLRHSLATPPEWGLIAALVAGIATWAFLLWSLL